MSRFFEKVPYEEFKKYYGDDRDLYEEYKLPTRATTYSAGYDFFAIKGFTIKPGEIKKIPTGFRSKFGGDEVLMIFVRGNVGIKYNVRLCNQVGIIETDYYGNPENGGHLFVALQNEGTEDFIVPAGRICSRSIY